MAHSEYWLGEDWQKTLPPRTSPRYIVRMHSVLRSVRDFVKIVTGRGDIDVRYSSGEQSYTDGRTIVISAETDPKNIDVVVGLALHESSHVLLSQDLMRDLGSVRNPSNVDIVKYAPRTAKHFPNLVTEKPEKLEWLFSQFVMCVNIVEDRRIDSWMYERLRGYRPYYDSLYSRYFFTGEVEHAMKSLAETYDCYMMALVNIHTPYFQTCNIKGRDALWNVMDLDNIRRLTGTKDRANTKEIYKVADTLLSTILDYVRAPEMQDAKKTPKQGEGQSVDQANPFSKDNFKQELPNLDQGDGQEHSNNIQPMTADEIKKVLDKQKEIVNGQVAKHDMDPEINKMIDLMDKTRALVVNGGDDTVGKYDTLIYHYIEGLDASYVANHRWGYTGENNPVAEGVSMGRILNNRVQVLQDAYPLDFNRQESGKIDRRRIASIGAGETNVFNRRMVIQHEPVFVHLTIDASGSMSGVPFAEAIKLATALATVSILNRAFDLTVSLRASNSYPEVAIVFDSRKHDLGYVNRVFPKLRTFGGTPEGLAYQAIMEEILRPQDIGRKFFINISDGEPAHSGYHGRRAAEHTRRQVNKMRENGVHILSYFIGSGYSGGGGNTLFDVMYGKDAAYINVSDISAIARTLNNLLLKE